MFKNAYFGKPYKTRDGRKAIYHSYDNIYPENPYQHHHNLILQKRDSERGDSLWIWANDYGHTCEHIEGKWLEESNADIVSEWQEPIDEKKLDKDFDKFVNSDEFRSLDTPYFYFKAGYRKAKEE